MVTVTIFWASVMVLVLFLLCTFFKLIKSFCIAIIEAGKKTLFIAACCLVAFLVISLIGTLLEKLITSGVLAMLSELLLSILGLGGMVLGIAIIVGICAWIWENFDFLIELALLPYILMLMLFEKFIEWTERGYVHFLKVIIKRLDKC